MRVSNNAMLSEWLKLSRVMNIIDLTEIVTESFVLFSVYIHENWWIEKSLMNEVAIFAMEWQMPQHPTKSDYIQIVNIKCFSKAKIWMDIFKLSVRKLHFAYFCWRVFYFLHENHLLDFFPHQFISCTQFRYTTKYCLTFPVRKNEESSTPLWIA